MQRPVQQRERLDVDHLDVDRRLLQQTDPLVDEGFRRADGEDLGGTAVLGAPEHLGVHDGLARREQAQLAMLDLERGQDLLRRERRQRHLADDDLGAADRGDHALSVGARGGERGVDGLGDLARSPRRSPPR